MASSPPRQGVGGWFLGGDGSGVWLGREVLRAVLADLDGLGPATKLTARVATELGVSPEELTPSALTGAVYGGVPAPGAGRFAHCAPWPPPHPHLPCRQPAPGLDATVQRWRRTR